MEYDLPAIPGAPWSVLALVFAFGYAIRFVTVWLASRFLRRTGLLPEGFSLKRHFRPSLHLVIFSGLVALALPFFSLTERAERLVARYDQIVLIIATTWFLTRLVKLLEAIVYESYSRSGIDELRRRRARTQFQFLYRIVVLLIVVLGIGAVLLSFQGARRFGASLIASAGVASVVVGSAAQKSLANLIAGFQLAFTQPVRIDDIVIVEKEQGRVEEITLSYVVIRTWDLRRLILPITYFLEKPFENWTRNTGELIGHVFVLADYTVPIEAVRREFQRLVVNSPKYNGGVCSFVVTGMNDKGIEMRGTFGARNASDAFDLKCELREKLVTFLQTNHPRCLPRARSESIPPIQTT
jgi:small-conductance mechanosensitive channel